LQELDNKENQLMLPSPLGGNVPSVANTNATSGAGIYFFIAI